MKDSTSLRRRAEEAFHAWLDAGSSGERPAKEAFLASLEPEIREEVGRILEDFEFLREGLGGGGARWRAGRVLGDFRLLRELGRGGSGVVWEAEQLSLKRRVALKILAAAFSLSGRRLEEFQREAQAGSRLNHPGIVAVFSVGECEGAPFLAQELVAGGRTLAHLLEERRKTPALPAGHFEEMARLFLKIAAALEAAHEAGVIHRDVKPGNILLTPEGEPKVADFGLARMEDELGLTRTGEMRGTPYYMSPEQVAAPRVALDPRTDVFSLGGALYEALTLERPFAGETSGEVFEKILLEDPPDPRRLRPGIPRDLAAIALKALAKKRSRRYADMHAFGEDLRRFLAGEPVLARPPGPAVRLWSRARRHPVLSVGGLIAAVALVATSFLLVRTQTALRDAETARSEAQAEASTAFRSAQAVADFLVTFLQEPGLGPGVSALLVKGARETLARFALEPEVRGNLLTTIGKALFALGRFDEAEPFLEEALALRRESAGDEDLKTAAALNALANVYTFQERYKEAEPLYREAHEIHRRVFGDDDDETLVNLGNLGGLLFRLERYDEAEPLLAKSLGAVRRAYGPDSPHTLAGIGNLVRVYGKLGRLEEAEPLMRERLAILERTRGTGDPQTEEARGSLARLLEQLQREK